MLAFHELGHVLVYSGLFYCINFLINFRFDKKQYLFGLAVSIFMDLDHLFDYFMYKGFQFNLFSFLNGDSFGINHKAYVPLHSWELLVLIFILFFYFERKQKKISDYLLLIFLGMFVHITYDIVYYGIAWEGYFFYLRLSNNFNLDVLMGIH